MKKEESTSILVYSGKESLEELLTCKRYKAILINPQELDRSEKQDLFDLCVRYDMDLLTTPDINKWEKMGRNIFEVRRLDIEELLSRTPIAIDRDSIGENLRGKSVMVTGAAGSIGSEIVRQISSFQIGTIVLCDNAETPIHELYLELIEQFPDINYSVNICNVQDRIQMTHIMAEHKPHYIYHAAAYKHVPLMESHPCEAVLTNVLGTKVMIDLAIANNAEVFVLISTDKAVNPSNVMGASKRIAEIYIQSQSEKLKEVGNESIRIITTRFGNILGSNGSIIPYFKKQIEKGGPITVTHPEIVRYFMTISEACRLVLEAGNFGKGGEVFLFDMGDPIKITDLAEQMIILSGLKPYEDIGVVYTGLRPGEKLFEELFYDREKAQPTHNRKIMIGSVQQYDVDYVEEMINKILDTALSYDKNAVVKIMKEFVPEFVSHNSIYSSLDKQTD